MMKNLMIAGATAAALAASMALTAPFATAQEGWRGEELAGGPQGRDWGRDDRGRRGDRGRISQDRAVDVCYRAMDREIGGRRAWSVQYDGEPRLRQERWGYELRGRVRIHGPGGFSHLETVCQLDGDRVTRFYVDR